MLNRIFVVDSVTLTSTGTAVSSYVPWDQSTRKLPTQVVIKATGQGAYVRLSNDNSAATNADVLVQAGDHVVLSVQGRRWVSVLSDGASSTVNVGALSTGVSGSAASLDLPFTGVSALDSRVTFTRASSATFVGSNGLIQSATTNTPRFDYDPITLAAKGLLIEEQRTNLLTYSEQFDNAAWVNNGGTVTANALVAPDGTTTADYLVRSTASADGRYQVIAAGTSGIVIVSVYIKKDTSPQSLLWLYDATAVADRILATVTWSGATPVITATTGTAATPQDAGNGWWRIAIASTALTGANTNRFYLLPAYTAASNGQQLAVWGAQLEAGSFATSYIPTVASQVTRSADVASVNTLSPWYNATEGTLYAEMTPYGVSSDTRFASIDDNTSANRVMIWGSSSSSSTRYEVITGGVTQVALTAASTLTANATTKSAAAYKVNDFAFSVNGGVALTDTTGTVPAVTKLTIGGSAGATVSNGAIRRITYYPRRLSNAELQASTA